ncbi:MAG: SHOCT domain-containing protein [Senegalia sp. (in: firmicutes)]|uniref:SHOCT domain-containing protein n=1 Tax=Senegalia sp. (in: firmicutes) TaxID=1924098 RepID=UPI003F978A27
MRQNFFFRIINNLRFTIGFLLFLISYLRIRALPTDYNTFLENALYETRSFAVVIIISLFLIYPIFIKVSKVLVLNYARFLIGALLIIITSFSLIEVLEWGARLGDLGFKELYLLNVDFAAYTTLFLTRILIGILLIKPFINLKEKRLNFEYREVIRTNKFSRKVDELFEKLTITLSKAINSFLDKSKETNKYSNVGKKNANKHKVGLGKEPIESKSSNVDQIIRASELLESGVITVEEFNTLKKDILDS